ncbi:hypothetical protein J132_06432 [Termitomyces sp. J132]|nr:hypothetical protein J132_06432 [Termitomyces sp. J132]
MRYCACTNTAPGIPMCTNTSNVSIINAVFWNVTIISAHNINKDTINMIGSAQFALESGQQLTVFFGEHTKVIGPLKGKGHASKGRCVPPSVQGILWQQPPSSTTTQVVGRLFLCILFMKLKNPPYTVQIKGLPQNVVPVTQTSGTMECCLPNNQRISVTRSQVEVLVNYTITDYANQAGA